MNAASYFPTGFPLGVLEEFSRPKKVEKIQNQTTIKHQCHLNTSTFPVRIPVSRCKRHRNSWILLIEKAAVFSNSLRKKENQNSHRNFQSLFSFGLGISKNDTLLLCLPFKCVTKWAFCPNLKSQSWQP